MFALITNDDGVFARGLRALVEEFVDGFEVVAVVPDRERTAISHAISLHKALRVHKVEGLLPCVAYVVNGTPADCVLIALEEILERRPDVVISGINRGPNVGEDVTYSGTVGAAIEATIAGIPAAAISITSRKPRHWRTAAHFAKLVAERLSEEGLPEGVYINVNVPDLPLEEVKGVEVTRQGWRRYKSVVEKGVDPHGGEFLWIGGGTPIDERVPGTDVAAMYEGKVSITPLKIDATCEEMIGRLKGWAEAMRAKR
ncbi:MAG TPA: 5'/3'-nucleotidase SurE [Armatimonadetes bacterium]|nr:5'/3'-nucleotidase SurE [Armatimonadota bacterium]